jgi:phosphatidylglycerophosphatase C
VGTGRGERIVAAFDFDGTLTRRDTLVPFLARVVGWPRVARAIVSDAYGMVRVAAGRADRDAAKERFLVRLLGGVPYDDVAREGDRYGEALVRETIRPQMRAVVDEHRSRGHEVVIVSASLDVYLEPVARLLEVDALLCTSLERDASNRCTGRMLGGNCRGPAKARRLAAHLARPLPRGTRDGGFAAIGAPLRPHFGAPVTLWAYGDSAGDAEMLAMADHPVRVRRGRV